MSNRSLKEIQDEIAALEKELKSAKKKSPAIAKIRKLMKDNGVTIDDLRAEPVEPAKRGRKKGAAKAAAKGKVEAKYRDATGNTWTGRGKTPRWLVDAEASGHNRSEFLIAAEAPAA